MITLLVFLAMLQSAGDPNLQIRDGHERRGAVLAYMDGLPAESAPACAAACGLNASCRAWTWRAGDPFRPARCNLQAHVTTPTAQPGAVTGLSPAFSAEIAAAMDRPLSARERIAARATSTGPGHVPVSDDRAEDELDGG